MCTSRCTVLLLTRPPRRQVDAERALLRAALRDPRNRRFALLSDACLPLHSAALVYAQLMAERQSRINVCRWEHAVSCMGSREEESWAAASLCFSITGQPSLGTAFDEYPVPVTVLFAVCRRRKAGEAR